MEKLEIRSFRQSGSRTAATAKMEHFLIIVNGWKLGCWMLDVAAVIDPPQFKVFFDKKASFK